MSRSYKKTPWSGDKKGKSKKRIASHKVRNWLKQHPEESLDGGSYKKVYETWDICDYGWVYTWEQYWESCVRSWREWGHKYGRKYPNEKEEYCRWLKYYKTK